MPGYPPYRGLSAGQTKQQQNLLYKHTRSLVRRPLSASPSHGNRTGSCSDSSCSRCASRFSAKQPKPERQRQSRQRRPQPGCAKAPGAAGHKEEENETAATRLLGAILDEWVGATAPGVHRAGTERTRPRSRRASPRRGAQLPTRPPRAPSCREGPARRRGAERPRSAQAPSSPSAPGRRREARPARPALRPPPSHPPRVPAPPWAPDRPPPWPDSETSGSGSCRPAPRAPRPGSAGTSVGSGAAAAARSRGVKARSSGSGAASRSCRLRHEAARAFIDLLPSVQRLQGGCVNWDYLPSEERKRPPLCSEAVCPRTAFSCLCDVSPGAARGRSCTRRLQAALRDRLRQQPFTAASVTLTTKAPRPPSVSNGSGLRTHRPAAPAQFLGANPRLISK